MNIVDPFYEWRCHPMCVHSTVIRPLLRRYSLSGCVWTVGVSHEGPSESFSNLSPQPSQSLFLSLSFSLGAGSSLSHSHFFSFQSREPALASEHPLFGLESINLT